MILKAITFNICHGEGLDKKIDIKRQANLIKTYKPDIVFLQEIDTYTKRAYNRNQIYNLSRYTGLDYRSMGINIKYKSGFYGDGLLSRFPIEYCANYLAPVTEVTHEQRGLLCTTVSVGTLRINLFSVHFSLYENERILTCKELLKITNNIKKNEVIIIAGDFNFGVTPIGKHRYTFSQADIFEESEILKGKFYSLHNTEPTWFSSDGTGCIDTCFYSKNIQLAKFETIKTDVSDHYPIYMEFII